MEKRKFKRYKTLSQVPAWMKKDARAHYHSIVDEGPTLLNVLITGEPFMLAGHTPCVFIEGVSGCVATYALSEPKAGEV